MYSLDALKFPELILFQLTLNTQRLPMKKHLVLQGKKKKEKSNNKKQNTTLQRRKQETKKHKKQAGLMSWFQVCLFAFVEINTSS